MCFIMYLTVLGAINTLHGPHEEDLLPKTTHVVLKLIGHYVLAVFSCYIGLPTPDHKK